MGVCTQSKKSSTIKEDTRVENDSPSGWISWVVVQHHCRQRWHKHTSDGRETIDNPCYCARILRRNVYDVHERWNIESFQTESWQNLDLHASSFIIDLLIIISIVKFMWARVWQF